MSDPFADTYYTRIPPPPPPPEHVSRVLLIGIVLVTFVLLIGGVVFIAGNYTYLRTVFIREAPTPKPTATPQPLTMVNWERFTYHTHECGTFTLYGDKTETIQKPQFHMYWIIGNPVYGNITGQVNAVILYACSSGAGNSPVYALVFAGSVRHPQLLGDLSLQSGGYYSGIISSAVILEGKTLQLTGSGYAPGDADCCPSLLVTTDYQWNGTSFVVQSSVSTVIPPTPMPTPSPTPMLVFYSAWDIYSAFVTAGIAMGNVGSLSNSYWTNSHPYYPAYGSVQLTDESSGGTIIIALFSTYNGLDTDATISHDDFGWGTYSVGTCLLLYNSAYTNLTPYEQVMQQGCR